jgi:hypothetical protein
MDAVSSAYKNKLKNKLFALLCEKEKNGEWESFLNNLYIEIFGNKNFLRTINYLELQAKMGALRYLDYPYFRSTIFDCMSLLGDEEDGDK